MCLHGPAFVHYRRRAGDLPVLVHVVSQRARVLRLRRTGQPLASNAAAVLPSSYSSGSRHPDLAFFEAQSPRPPMPRSTLRNTPRDVPRKTRGQDGVAFSFPVGLLHPLQHAGLTRRTTYNALPFHVTYGVCPLSVGGLPTTRQTGLLPSSRPVVHNRYIHCELVDHREWDCLSPDIFRLYSPLVAEWYVPALR